MEKIKLDMDIYKVIDIIFMKMDYWLMIAIKSICRTLLIKPENFLEKYKYEYESLRATIYCNLLFDLYDEYTKEMPIREVIKKMSDNDYAHAFDTNRKRLEYIRKRCEQRSEANKKYFHMGNNNFKPRMRVPDALYYELLSECPLLKRLLNDDVAFSKKTFDDINSVYDKIERYDGYNKFFLFHKVEAMFKIELFYKALISVRKEKTRLKLSDEAVQNLLYKVSGLHNINLYHEYFKSFAVGSEEAYQLFGWINYISPDFRTVNDIVINIDRIVQDFAKEPEKTIEIFTTLNFIQQSVYLMLSSQIYYELNVDNKNGMEFVEKIQMSDKTAEYFNKCLELYPHINRNKNCSEDIRLSHFKKIYKAKKEPPRTQNSSKADVKK